MSDTAKIKKMEKRLKKLENVVFKKSTSGGKQGKSSKDHSGLSGGIRLLIHDGFFKKPRELKEIFAELKRENYHYSKATVAKILARDFVKRLRILSRIKEEKNFMYVLRK